MEPTSKFTIERVDEKTAKKTDNTESITILNMDILRQQKEELEQEVELRQRSLAEIGEIISEFDKLPVPPKEEPVAEPEIGEEPVPSEEAPANSE